MRLEPFRPHGDDALVDAGGIFSSAGIGFASDGVFEELFRGARIHGVYFSRACVGVKGKHELARERLEGVARGTRRNRGDGAAAGEELQLVDGVASAAGLAAHESDGAADAFGGNAAFGDIFDGAERNQVAEIVEAFAPPRAGMNETKTLPVTQARRLDAHDAAHFPLCEAFGQTLRFPRDLRRPAEVAACIDYAPRVNSQGGKSRHVQSCPANSQGECVCDGTLRLLVRTAGVAREGGGKRTC